MNSERIVGHMKQLGLFDYSALDAATRSFVQERAERIHNLARMTATGIVQIGQYLTEVKERLAHGQFRQWIEGEFGWSRQSAVAFMQVYQRFKCQNFGHLQIDISALYRIAAPKTPEPVRHHIVARAQNGQVITNRSVRAVVQHYQSTGGLPDVANRSQSTRTGSLQRGAAAQAGPGRSRTRIGS